MNELAAFSGSYAEARQKFLDAARKAGGVARATFDELCNRPLGPADYLAIADRFHTLILDDIPRMGPDKATEARRFVTLIDALVPLGLPRAGHGVMMRILGLTAATLLVIFILQNRHVVTRWLRGDAEAANGQGLRRRIHRIRQTLAGCWHGLAIFYVAVIYFIWALELPGGFEFVIQRTLGTIAVGVALWVLSSGLRFVMDRAFTVADELRARYPSLESRANLYLPILQIGRAHV